MGLDAIKSGTVVLPSDSKDNLLIIHAWDFVGVDPADDNIICEVQSLDGKAEFRILGSIDEEMYPGTGFGPSGEWFVIHGNTRLTASTGEAFSNTYTKHPYMVVVADNPTPNPVTVQAILYGRDSLGDPSEDPPEILGSWGAKSQPQVNSLQVTGITVDETCDYFVAIANEDDRQTDSFTGMGLTWTKDGEAHNTGDVRTSIWKGTGTATGAGEVTGNFSGSGSTSSTAMLVFAMKRVDNTDPSFDVKTNNGGGTSVTVNSVATEDFSSILCIIGEDDGRTVTPDSGWVVHSSEIEGTDVAIHLLIKEDTTGATESMTHTLSDTADWAAIGYGIRRS